MDPLTNTLFSSADAVYEIRYDTVRHRNHPYTEISLEIKTSLKANTLYQTTFEYQTENKARPFFILVSTPYDLSNIPLHEELSLSDPDFRKVIGWFRPEKAIHLPVLQLRN